jgi:hypothetical protein
MAPSRSRDLLHAAQLLDTGEEDRGEVEGEGARVRRIRLVIESVTDGLVKLLDDHVEAVQDSGGDPLPPPSPWLVPPPRDEPLDLMGRSPGPPEQVGGLLGIARRERHPAEKLGEVLAAMPCPLARLAALLGGPVGAADTVLLCPDAGVGGARGDRVARALGTKAGTGARGIGRASSARRTAHRSAERRATGATVSSSVLGRSPGVASVSGSGIGPPAGWNVLSLWIPYSVGPSLGANLTMRFSPPLNEPITHT